MIVIWPYSFENLCEAVGLDADYLRRGIQVAQEDSRLMARPRSPACANMNHRRRDAPVSHCPECGGVVNAQLALMHCADAKHAGVADGKAARSASTAARG